MLKFWTKIFMIDMSFLDHFSIYKPMHSLFVDTNHNVLLIPQNPLNTQMENTADLRNFSINICAYQAELLSWNQLLYYIINTKYIHLIIVPFSLNIFIFKIGRELIDNHKNILWMFTAPLFCKFIHCCLKNIFHHPK